jgi:hypothetical protein
LKGDNFLVWNGMVSYPYEVAGYKLVTQFHMDNILSKKYIDGGGATTGGVAILADTANWQVTTTLQF